MNRFTVLLVLIFCSAVVADESKPSDEKNQSTANTPAGEAQTDEETSDAPDYEAMVAALVNIKAPGFGYSEVPSGLEFLPYRDSSKASLRSFDTNGTPPPGQTIAPAPEMVALVSAGVDVVPTLLQHLTDSREVTTVRPPPAMYGEIRIEYDSYSSGQHPVDFRELSRARNRNGSGTSLMRPHRITVGDLCFVALGQIVNRDFNTVSYEDDYLYICSTSRDNSFAEVIRSQWKSLTAESHRQSLRSDFDSADSYMRRSGAYQRLSLYYPEETEALVLQHLNRTVIDYDRVENLRQRLFYRVDPQAWDPIIAGVRQQPNSDALLSGLRESLFNDLEYLESDDMMGRWESHSGGDLRETKLMLSHVFGLPRNVKSVDREAPTHTTFSERSELISTLIHDKSKQVGERVKQIFEESAEDSYETAACLKCLAHRDFGGFVRTQLQKIDGQSFVTNELHVSWLDAVSSTTDEATIAMLTSLRDETRNPDYFAALVTGGLKVEAKELEAKSIELIQQLPNDSTAGATLLDLVRTEIPAEAESLYRLYMGSGSWLRAAQVCHSLTYLPDLNSMFEPDAVLAELLDDKRTYTGNDNEMYKDLRICDLAALALSGRVSESVFDSEWPIERRDKMISIFRRHMNLEEVSFNPMLWLTEPEGLSPLRLSLLLLVVLGVVVVIRPFFNRTTADPADDSAAKEN